MAAPNSAAALPATTPAAAPRPQRTTPGGGSLAALLIHNRTKTGPQKVMEPEGATPSLAQPHAPSGSFDLLEVTAVGGAQGEGGSGAPSDASSAAGGGPARKSYLTPGGGLPGLLARTQLGLGDAIRAFREAGGRPDVAAATGEPSGGGSATTAAAPAAAPAVVSPPVAAAPAPGGEDASAATPPPVSTAEAAAVSAGDSGSAAVSGPVFDLATGPAAGSGPVSGPVFDLVSGPFSGPATTVTAPRTDAAETPDTAATSARGPEPAAPRPSASTTASGRLAALLAESRKRTGSHEILGKAAAPSATSGSGPVVAAPNATPAGGTPVSASGPVEQDVATMRVPGAELAQKKGPGFAATLLGLPAPEVTPPVVRGGAAAGGSLASQARQFRRGPGDAGADRNTPELVEGDATERSLLSSGDLRARWGRSSEEQKRTTEIVDIVRPNRSAARMAAVILGGAAVLVVILVAVARNKRSGGDETTAVTTAPAGSERNASAPAAPAATTATEKQVPAAAPPAPGEAPLDEAARAGEARSVEPQEMAAGNVRAGEAAGGESRAASRAEKPAAPPVEAGAEAPSPLPSSFRETGSATATRTSDGEPRRKVARSESRRSDARREPKTRRRTAEARSARPEGTATAASYEMPRTRVAQPLRPVQADPDGTLPLGMQ